jgi:hypothetical protein
MVARLKWALPNARLDYLDDATNERLGGVNERLDSTNERLGAVEQGLLELAEQQMFVVRPLRGSSARDRRVDAELDNLRLRLDALESRRDR